MGSKTHEKDPFLECEHHIIEGTCIKCGLVLNDIIIGETYTKTCNVILDHPNWYYPVVSETKLKKKRLNNMHKIAMFDGVKSTLLRYYQELETLKNMLRLPANVVEGSWLRFKKIVDKEIFGGVGSGFTYANILAMCIWESVRANKFPLRLEELAKTYKEMGHKTSRKLIFRYLTKFTHIFPQLGFKRTTHVKPIHYVEFALQKLKKGLIERRAKKKRIEVNFPLYINTLREKLNDKIPSLEINSDPLKITVACIYAYSLRITSKKILTFGILSRLYDISEDSIRFIFHKIWGF